MHKHRKSSMGKSRDIGTGNNGKGDGDRTSDTAAYSANYDEIDWRSSERIINPDWTDAPPNIADEGVDGFRSLNTAPNPALEDFENWDR